jgi:hypothetical protein
VGRETEARLAYADVARPMALDGAAAEPGTPGDASADRLDQPDLPADNDPDDHDPDDHPQGAPA